MTCDPNPDRALIHRCGEGDRAAFDALARRHGPRLLAFLQRLLGDRSLAEDALQGTFLAAFRHAGGYRGDSARAWLLTIARNEASRLRAREERATRNASLMDSLMDLGVAAGWGTRDPEHLVSLAQQSERLKDALQRLEGSEREVLLLRDVQQLSGKETAQALGLPIAAMKSRLHRARLRLAVELRKGKDAR